jgi:branched-chain amino acid transport system permease protein
MDLPQIGLTIDGHLLGSALVAGLAAGSIYALLAFGFILVFSTSNVFNFAQGDLVTLGGVSAYVIYVSVGFPAALALLAVVLVVALVGASEERLAVWPVSRVPEPLGWMVTTLGFGIVLRNLIALTWGSGYRNVPSPFGASSFKVLGIAVSTSHVAAIVSAVVVAIGLEVFYGRTMLGKAMLAVAEDKEAASVRGINVHRFAIFSFALAGAISGLAGFVIAPSTLVSSQLGVGLGIKTFVVMAIGGFTSHRGAVVGGLLFGLVESFSELYVAGVWVELIGLALVVGILSVFPGGLFGEKTARRI